MIVQVTHETDGETILLGEYIVTAQGDGIFGIGDQYQLPDSVAEAFSLPTGVSWTVSDVWNVPSVVMAQNSPASTPGSVTVGPLLVRVVRIDPML